MFLLPRVVCVLTRRLQYRLVFRVKYVNTSDVWEGGGGHGLDRSGSGYGQVAGLRECGNEPSVSIKCGEFLEELRTC